MGNNQQTNSEQKKSKSLKIHFIFRTNKADEFKIMMNNIEVDELQKKQIHISENVEPSSNDDYIVANFDPDNISKQIVIQLGSKIEKEVIINGILISFGDKTVNLNSPEDFNKHLVFNKFIERDSTSNKLITKRIEGKLNPTIRLKNSLINQLQR
ncbi:hypothetical protein [Winogradskyella sp. A2]|uniref:hypothetical protein n=1 Tax=Winogradskyella sp. A2 TaxID=3366944 RepID=UPI00398C72FA